MWSDRVSIQGPPNALHVPTALRGTAAKTEIVTDANSVDPDEPPHRDLNFLPSGL